MPNASGPTRVYRHSPLEHAHHAAAPPSACRSLPGRSRGNTWAGARSDRVIAIEQRCGAAALDVGVAQRAERLRGGEDLGHALAAVLRVSDRRERDQRQPEVDGGWTASLSAAT